MTSNTTDTTLVLTAEDTTAFALVATIKAAVNGDGKYAAYTEDHAVTTENVKDHARALAVLAYPNDKPVQKIEGARTRFGNAVQAAGNGLRNALGKADKPAKDVNWLALLVQAAENAVNNGITEADAVAAVLSTVGLNVSDLVDMQTTLALVS